MPAGRPATPLLLAALLALASPLALAHDGDGAANDTVPDPGEPEEAAGPWWLSPVGLLVIAVVAVALVGLVVAV